MARDDTTPTANVLALDAVLHDVAGLAQARLAHKGVRLEVVNSIAGSHVRGPLRTSPTCCSSS